MPTDPFSAEHTALTRRYFLGLGAAGAAALGMTGGSVAGEPRHPRLQAAIDALEPWLTPADAFRDVSRGTPVPHTLNDEQRQQAGLTRETWKLEVISDPDQPAKLKTELTTANGTALDFAGLMQLAEQHAVRFAKVMTCLNIGCPLGTGIWEGVPLREVLWLTQPRENLRRVYYHGFHNNDPEQLFQSSLPVSRVLEDPFDLPPVILCYKLNGEWLTPERGGPVRVVVPEAYGFKSIKWLKTIVLSNLFYANDTYGEKNNDVDSPLKSFAATLNPPMKADPDAAIPITGYAQVGISGVSKVQVWIQNDADTADHGRYFADAPWLDADILPPPSNWGSEIPLPTLGFERESGRPLSWPMRLTKVHWATLHPGLPAGDYTLHCRTIDDRGIAQPMPRPFQKSGHAAIENVALKVGE
ncbi:MAG: molybdopterin-dependent oxidoreductase [Planctomycetaceae bacterium]|nr:molybdopterin-dependent oxidoreductase [Planctomycetaceae bacterium]